jgi:hypothetical protein
MEKRAKSPPAYFLHCGESVKEPSYVLSPLWRKCKRALGHGFSTVEKV